MVEAARLTTTLQGALNALTHLGCRPVKSGNEFIAYCPIHEADGQGHKPSLTLRQGDRQDVLVHCHAGCNGAAILKALGLNGASRPATHRQMAVYSYRNAEGREVRQKVRFEPKDFRIRHKGPDGEWVYKAGDGPAVLYRLPELKAAITEGRTVFLCEGEKDADRLAALGLVATTNIEGAAQPGQRPKWKREYTDQLRGAARVALLPDHDEPGRAHMGHIAKELAGKAMDVRLLELPGLPPKGDVSDWLSAGHTADELKALVKDAPATPLKQTHPDTAAHTDTHTDTDTAASAAEAEAEADPAGIDPGWRTDLIGKPREDGGIDILCRAYNLILILENDPLWRGHLALNAFSQQITCQGKTWGDAQVGELKAWLEKQWITGEVKTATIHEAVEVVAHRHEYHPVKQYLLPLQWDRQDRLSTFFRDFCDAPLTPYTAAVGRSLFLSAVARIFDPGAKVDTMVVLEGQQGAGKSQLVLAIFGKEFHMEVTEAPGSVDFYQSLRGRWCCEFGEMAALGRSDKNRIKQVLSQLQDTYRASYARYSKTYPRQNIFIGTTNKDDWGDDETGLRRFLPIRCGRINVQAVRAVRDQLWAEAVARYRRGETWYEIPDAEREQDARYQQDAWEERVSDWLKERRQTTVLEVMEDCLYLKSDRQGKSEQIRIGNILRRLKWVRKQETNGDRRRYYVPLTIGRSNT